MIGLSYISELVHWFGLQPRSLHFKDFTLSTEVTEPYLLLNTLPTDTGWSVYEAYGNQSYSGGNKFRLGKMDVDHGRLQQQNRSLMQSNHGP